MTEKIEALIAEAREWSSDYASWGDNGLVDRLADALEAATRERDGHAVSGSRDAALQRLRRVSADRLRELEQVKLERDLAVKRAEAAESRAAR